MIMSPDAENNNNYTPFDSLVKWQNRLVQYT